ncbi:hypothetical protein KGQ19_02375 [Catenulispora sp. NL8]|uniref:ABC transporter substrate-binding protein n=1 Tax=Catenulispora pinistramenti TaxID=2705254 RepID=A0ABS5KI31_9ACTN|nr:hypothetical protein [Catenulispora pinistramenti]MBS2545707.1 hypothetical protein [Catenulispora pinistramenti]
MSRESRITPISGDGPGPVTDRRTLLRASLGGAGLLLAAPALAACGKSSASSSGSGGGGNQVKIKS